MNSNKWYNQKRIQRHFRRIYVYVLLTPKIYADINYSSIFLVAVNGRDASALYLYKKEENKGVHLTDSGSDRIFFRIEII